MKRNYFTWVLLLSLFYTPVAYAEKTGLGFRMNLGSNGGRTEVPPNPNSQTCATSTESSVIMPGNNNLQRSWGYMYVPAKLKISSKNHRLDLKDEGPQDICLVGADAKDHEENPDFATNPRPGDSAYNTYGIHLGVKNRSRKEGSWGLFARLEIDSKIQLPGIRFSAGETIIRDNYQSNMTLIKDNELIAFDENALLDNWQGATLSLNTDSQMIMQGKENIIHNGTYDCAFRKVQIKIPDVRRLQNETYRLKIHWTLSNVPAAKSTE